MVCEDAFPECLIRTGKRTRDHVHSQGFKDSRPPHKIPKEHGKHMYESKRCSTNVHAQVIGPCDVVLVGIGGVFGNEEDVEILHKTDAIWVSNGLQIAYVVLVGLIGVQIAAALINCVVRCHGKQACLKQNMPHEF
jgi:hypothetical protein